MKSVLFLGGPFDGRRMTITDVITAIDVTEPPGDPVLFSMLDADPADVAVRKWRYYLHQWHAKDTGESVYFLTLDSVIDNGEVMRMLWEGYRVPERTL